MTRRQQEYDGDNPKKYVKGSKKKKEQERLLAKGRRASKTGEKLSPAYFKARAESAAIGGKSLDAVGKKIKKLLDEGMPRKQAIAVALSMKERGELK